MTCNKKNLIVFILFVFLLKLILIIFFIDNFIVWEEWKIAVTMLNTGEMKFFHHNNWNYNFTFPFYPVVLFLLFKTFEANSLYPIILQLVVSSFTAFLLYEVLKAFVNYINLSELKKHFLYKTAFFSIAVYLIHPAISYYQLKNVHPFTFDLFFSLLILKMMFYHIRTRNTFSLVAYGITLGFGLLERSTLIAAIVPMIFLLFLENTILKSIQKIIVIAVISLMVLSPWLIRNYSIYNEIAMTSTVSEVLWKGVAYGTDGGNHLINGDDYIKVLSEGERKKLMHLTVVQQKTFFNEKYFEILNNDPLHVGKMFIVKLKNFWWFRQYFGITYNDQIKQFIPAYKTYYIICLIFAFCSVFVLKKYITLFLSYPIALSLLQSFFYVETRHRVLIEPFLLYLAIVGIAYCYYLLIKKTAL